MSGAQGTVLLTGASAFTGVWIAEALAAAGFKVLAPLLRERDAYDGVRRDRVLRLERCAQVSFGRPFGSDPFLDDIRASGGIRRRPKRVTPGAGHRSGAARRVPPRVGGDRWSLSSHLRM